MSYSIERGKRVLSFRTDDERFNCKVFGDVLLYVVACSDNNVYPRTYDWNVVAHGNFSDWNNEVQLPAKLWEAAKAADGGSIQPYNRAISGISYIKSWKQAAKKPLPIFTSDGRLLWHPTISIWAGVMEDTRKPDEIETHGAALFSPKYRHLRQPLYDAFKRLFPDPLRASNVTRPLFSRETFLDAMFPYTNREDLPFHAYITDDEDCRFLRSGEQQELITA